jgi:vancomycin resistance protein VanW
MLSFLKRHLPYTFRVRYKALKRWVADVRSGAFWHLAKAQKTVFVIEKNYTISTTQPILPTPQTAAKIKNIALAAQNIHKTSIAPNQIFSFWESIGEPSAAKGYQKGRNIIDGALVEDTGGGLCQLASILYYMALRAGLPILERHNHSIDIYTCDADRFTPLGADATIVFAFKDLRFRNPFPFAIAFDIDIKNETELTCTLYSPQPIPEKTVFFSIKTTEQTDRVVVETICEGVVLAESFYKK